MTGIVFFALGGHRAIDEIGQPLTLLPAIALAGGVALAYAGDVAYRWGDHHRLATDRLVAGAASAAVIPLALTAPAMGRDPTGWHRRDLGCLTAATSSLGALPGSEHVGR